VNHFDELTRPGYPWLSWISRTFVRPGVVLMREDEPSCACYVIVDGVAEVSIGGSAESVLSAGDYVGSVALPERPAVSGTVTSSTPMELLVLSAAELSRLKRQAPGIAARAMESISSSLQENARVEVLC
jgi:CRP-like cAMP-binding protein